MNSESLSLLDNNMALVYIRLIRLLKLTGIKLKPTKYIVV